MKRLILSLFLLCGLSWGALPDYTTVWEVEHAGSDTNGGGFVTGASGTDMSQFPNKNATSCTSCQSATVNLSTTDAVCAGTTTLTSTTANFSSALVGNIIHLNGGSGSLAAVWKEVTAFTNSTTVTIDSSCATGTGITMNIGGALGTFLQGNNNMALTAAAGLWVKADATYTFSAGTVTLGGTSPPNAGVAFVSGYTSSRGDGGQITVQASGGAGSDLYMIYASGTASGTVMSNVIIDCNSQIFTGGFRFHSGNYITIRNVKAENCSDAGFYWNGVQGQCNLCVTTNTPAAGISGNVDNTAFYNFNGQMDCFDCMVLGTTKNGVVGFLGACGTNLIGVIVANLTGTGTTGIQCTTQEMDGLNIIGGAIYGVTGDAIKLSENQAIDMRPRTIRNVAMSNIGGYCLDNTGTLVLPQGALNSDHNACNPSGGSGFYNNWPAGVGDITMSTSPFTNGGSNDFSLNTTSGGGAAIRALGFPGVTAGGTGHIDIGALQHADPSSGGGQVVSGYSQ